MRIKCPNCKVPIEIVDIEATKADSTCPVCGSALGEPPGNSTIVWSATDQVKRVGKYVLGDLIGVGAFGMVFVARDTELDREVAIKIARTDEGMSTERKERFLREARSAAQLSHAAIVTVHEVGDINGVPFIVSRLINGSSLRDWSKSRTLTASAIADILAKVAVALHYAHQRGVIHRDVKATNILMDEVGQPHLTDFGLAKRDAEITMTVDGQILGTPAYMSPEQAMGKTSQIDARSDIYSLGVVLYEQLAGQLPFTGSKHFLLDQVARVEPRPPREFRGEVPKDLETICLKCMEKAPDNRYQTADELAADLRRFIERQPIVAKPVPSWKKLARWSHRNPAFASVAAVACLLTMALIAMVVVDRQPPTPSGKQRVLVTTEPNGAMVAVVPLHPIIGEPMPEQTVHASTRTPSELELEPGDYLVEAVSPHGNFHQVFRHIPEPGERAAGVYNHQIWTPLPDDRIEWITIQIPGMTITQGMCFFEGGEFEMGSPAILTAVPHREIASPFWLDCTEVTKKNFIETLPKERVSEVIGRDPDDFPIRYVTWHQAVAYCEKRGKRLMWEREYEYAARAAGTQRYPWGNEPEPEEFTVHAVSEAGNDRTRTQPPVLGLYSNVGEWTQSWPRPFGIPLEMVIEILPEESKFLRIGRGATSAVIMGDPAQSDSQWNEPAHRPAFPANYQSAFLGLRAAKSDRPEYVVQD